MVPMPGDTKPRYDGPLPEEVEQRRSEPSFSDDQALNTLTQATALALDLPADEVEIMDPIRCALGAAYRLGWSEQRRQKPSPDVGRRYEDGFAAGLREGERRAKERDDELRRQRTPGRE